MELWRLTNVCGRIACRLDHLRGVRVERLSADELKDLIETHQVRFQGMLL